VLILYSLSLYLTPPSPHSPYTTLFRSHVLVGDPRPAGLDDGRPDLRDPRRQLPVREGGEVAALHADGDLLRRRRHHLEVRLRVPRRRPGADRPAQRDPRTAGVRAPPGPPGLAVEHLLPHRRDDLDPGGVRDGAALRRDQGHPR